LIACTNIANLFLASVTSRASELATRIALGAMRRDILSWVFSNGLRPVLIGLAIGLAAAIMIARALRSLLFGISATDFISLGTVALVLLLTSALACYLPARRAAQLDPMAALRHE
jgi:putative ABC transport system permease protein